eukprot:Nk52_evm18s307 gene=Nk52_evmTU18s307
MINQESQPSQPGSDNDSFMSYVWSFIRAKTGNDSSPLDEIHNTSLQTFSFTSTDGVKIGYASVGNPSDPTIVICPGLTATAMGFLEWFADIGPPSVPGVRLVAMDYRGWGLSQGPWGEDVSPNSAIYKGMSMDQLAADLKELLEHANVRKPSFLGHSLGVNVILNYISVFGTDNVGSLILLDQSPKNLSIGNPADPSFPADLATFKTELAFTWTEKYATFFDGKYINVKSALREQFKVLSSEQPKAFTMSERGLEEWLGKMGPANGNVLAFQFWSSMVRDYTSVCSLIYKKNIPVFLYGGEASIVPVESIRWLYKAMTSFDDCTKSDATHKCLIFDSATGVHSPFLNEGPSRKAFLDAIKEFCKSVSLSK